MGEMMDKIRGRMKRATGEATGDRALERQGRMDEAKGKAKEKWEELKEGARDSDRRDPLHQE